MAEADVPDATRVLAREEPVPPQTSRLLELTDWPTPTGGRLTLVLHRGDLLLVTGRNGSGKTSLLRALANLTPHPVSGEACRAMVFQDPRDGLIGLTVAGEHTLRGLPAPPGAWSRRESTQLSTGEARRVALATAHWPHPETGEVLLLDEPAEGLDDQALADVMARVKSASANGAVVFVDHTQRLAHLATRRLELSEEGLEHPWPKRSPGAGPALHFPGQRHAERGIDLPALTLGPGLHVVTGSNGSGKTTLLWTVAGVWGDTAHLSDGRALALGTTARLLLAHNRDTWSTATVATALAGTEIWAANEIPDAWLERHPLSLSGGEAQRVALVACLGRPAPAYVLDEPESHLDAAGHALLGRLLAHRIADGAVILAASHDPEVIGHAASRIPMPATNVAPIENQETKMVLHPPSRHSNVQRTARAYGFVLALVVATAGALIVPVPLVAAAMVGAILLHRGNRRTLLGFALTTFALHVLLLALFVPGPGACWNGWCLSQHGAVLGLEGATRLVGVTAINLTALSWLRPAHLLADLRLAPRVQARMAALLLAVQDIGRDYTRLRLAQRLATPPPVQSPGQAQRDGKTDAPSETRRRTAQDLRRAAQLLPTLVVASHHRASIRRDALHLSGHRFSDRFVPILAYSALAAAGRMALVAVPNVALSYVVVYLAGLLHGARVGLAVAAVSMLATDLLLTGLLPLGFVNIPAMAIVALMGAAMRHVPARDDARATAVLAGGLGVLATFLFSVASDVATWLILPEYRSSPDSLRALVAAGLAFNIVPAVVNGILFAVATGPVLRALQAAGFAMPPAGGPPPDLPHRPREA